MFRFEDPLVLGLILVLPAVLWLRVRGAKRGATIRYSAVDAVLATGAGRSRWALRIPPLLRGLALTGLVIALAISYPASGCGVGLAQATLTDSDPTRREALMTRWVFMGTLGDLATPLLFGLLAWIGMGWREAFVVTGMPYRLATPQHRAYRSPPNTNAACHVAPMGLHHSALNGLWGL